MLAASLPSIIYQEKPKANPDARRAAVAAFEAGRTPRQQQIDRKIDTGQWADDWTSRARLASLGDMQERASPSKCKARPKDSRNNRGSGNSDERFRYVPWCK